MPLMAPTNVPMSERLVERARRALVLRLVVPSQAESEQQCPGQNHGHDDQQDVVA